jgi:hypothetical protein
MVTLAAFKIAAGREAAAPQSAGAVSASHFLWHRENAGTMVGNAPTAGEPRNRGVWRRLADSRLAGRLGARHSSPMSRRTLGTLIGLALLAIPNLDRIARVFERAFAWIADAPEAIGKMLPVLTSDYVAWAMMAVGLAVIAMANLPPNRDQSPKWSSDAGDGPAAPDAVGREPHKLRESVHQTTGNLLERVEALENDLLSTDLDMRVIIDYCIYSLMRKLIEAARQCAPREIVDDFNRYEITDQWLDDQIYLISKYIDHVSKDIGATRLAVDLRSTLKNAEILGAKHVAFIAQDDGLAHLDLSKFKEYGIARAKYDYVGDFLLRAQQGLEREQEFYLGHLRARLHSKQGQSKAFRQTHNIVPDRPQAGDEEDG